MTLTEEEAITGLLDAIGNYLGPQSDVRLACAAVCGCGLSPAAVAEFTRLLGGGGTSWGAPGGNPWSCGGCGVRYPGTVSPAPGGRCADCQALAAQNVIDDTGHAVNACTGPGWCTCGGHVDAGGTFHPAVAS